MRAPPRSTSLTFFFAAAALLLCCSGVVANINCVVTLPRLLIGSHYSNKTNTETAVIMFDTIDDCTGATLIVSPGQNLIFNLKETVLQFVNQMIGFKQATAEQVSYSKYSIVFSVQAVIGTTYTVGFQGDATNSTTISPLTYSFKMPISAPPAIGQANPKIMFFGDQDLTTRGQAQLTFLQNNVANNRFDALFFLGDYAYEFYQNNGVQGDNYVAQLAPLSFAYPLAMAPGNHEYELNFTLFNEKFRMPGFNATNLNNYNSFNMGLIHFVHVNLHFYSITTPEFQTAMITWLTNDLSKVDRTVTPWVVAFGHKLMYCYNPLFQATDSCATYYSYFSSIDSVFDTFGVDLFVTGHEHYNEVMAPMSRGMIRNYTFNQVTGALTFGDRGYVSIVQGNGGMKSSPNRMLDATYEDVLRDATLFVNQNNIGYGYIQAINSTNLIYQSYDIEDSNSLIFQMNIASTRPRIKDVVTHAILLSAFSAIALLFF